MELELEPSHLFTLTADAHLHGHLLTAASYPTATMLPSLKMKFSIRWRSSPDPIRDMRVIREFTPSFSDTMLHGDRVWEQAVEGMLVSALAPSRYNPSTEDMGEIVRSICAYGGSALLQWFRSPNYCSFVLKTFIIFHFHGAPPAPVDDLIPSSADDLATLPGIERLDFFYDYLLNWELIEAGVDDYLRIHGVSGEDHVEHTEETTDTELIEAEIENDFPVGAEAAAIRGLETSIHGGGDHVDHVGETATSCVICLGEYEEGVEIIKMPCGHRFHGPCLREWLQRRHMCPFCRFPLPPQR